MVLTGKEWARQCAQEAADQVNAAIAAYTPYVWPAGAVLYLKRWTWQRGMYADGRPDYDTGLSLNETLDALGYVTMVPVRGQPARRLKLRGVRPTPIIEDLRVHSLAELPAELTEPVHLTVPGVRIAWYETLKQHAYTLDQDAELEIEAGRRPIIWVRERLEPGCSVGVVPLELSGGQYLSETAA